MNETRPRGVTLQLIDWTALLSEVRVGPDETVEPGFGPYAVAERDGRLYVLCSEGVGWEVTDAEPLDVDLYVSSPATIALAPRYRMTLDADEVRGAVTAESVDLADHVRRFGARLESNFAMWHRTLTS